MYFITNHDENSWNNYPAILGKAENAMAVLSHTFDGMPLIYSGQESGLKDTISFFHKDQFDWGKYKNEEFYTKLNKLKHINKALQNGVHGGKMIPFEMPDPNILGYTREKDGDQVMVFINMSNESIKVPKPKFIGKKYMRKGASVGAEYVKFSPWGYMVFSEHPEEE